MPNSQLYNSAFLYFSSPYEVVLRFLVLLLDDDVLLSPVTAVEEEVGTVSAAFSSPSSISSKC